MVALSQGIYFSFSKPVQKQQRQGSCQWSHFHWRKAMTRVKRGSDKPHKTSIEIKPSAKPKKRNSPEVTSKSGRVKIYLPTGKKQYPLTYFEDGKQKGTTAQSLTHSRSEKKEVRTWIASCSVSLAKYPRSLIVQG